jgi:hypothetical protein
MPQMLEYSLGVYLPPVSDQTPMEGIVLYGVGCIVMLVCMVALIRNTRKKNKEFRPRRKRGREQNKDNQT